jgi:hypothetical protein
MLFMGMQRVLITVGRDKEYILWKVYGQHFVRSCPPTQECIEKTIENKRRLREMKTELQEYKNSNNKNGVKVMNM